MDLTDRDMPMFEVPSLKILGCICLIDQGELDWKIIAIDEAYAIDRKIRDAETFNQRNPGAIKEVINWLRIYKTYDGKAENTFGYDEKVLSVEKTIEIIYENNKSYLDLINGIIQNKDNLYLKKSKH